MKETEFDIFRVNCWLQDLDDGKRSSAIRALTFEYLLSKSNKDQPRKEIYNFISDTLGIKLQYQEFEKITDECDELNKEALDDDVLLKLEEGTIEKFRSQQREESIDHWIEEFITNSNYPTPLIQSTKDLFLKTIHININSFIAADLKTLISDSVKEEFTEEEVDVFNEFIDWNNDAKDRAVYSLFEKSIEFALLTSGRGVSNITKDIFTDKTYFLDANIVIRALGVDGIERKESIVSVLESCNHDGVNFKISKVTYDEIYGIINRRSRDIEDKTSSDSENLLEDMMDEIPFNNSFETDYISKRKAGSVSSPSNYRLSLEQELEIFTDKFSLKVDTIKGIPSYEVTSLSKKLYDTKTKQYGRWSYTKLAALVDAKNVLNVKQIRGGNDYNYKDIKSFYLTTDGTLNEIIANEAPDNVSETILPSQLFIIHNSFHKITQEKDYKGFMKFIKMRKTDFKLPGREIFSYLDQIRSVSSNPEDIKSSLRAYANYRFQKLDKKTHQRLNLIPIKEFTQTLLEKKLGEAKEITTEYKQALDKAIADLDKLFEESEKVALLIEILTIIVAAIVLFFTLQNLTAISLIIAAIIFFRIILFSFKDKFGIHKGLRNAYFGWRANNHQFAKVHANEGSYLETISKYKNR